MFPDLPDSPATSRNPVTKTGAQPGVLLQDLISGDGPFTAIADGFVNRRCDVCHGRTSGQLVLVGERLQCAGCMSEETGLVPRGTSRR